MGKVTRPKVAIKSKKKSTKELLCKEAKQTQKEDKKVKKSSINSVEIFLREREN